jgi:hypothetical protein
MTRYRVMVDDFFHYQDAEERRTEGTYETLAEALAACYRIVDRSLEEEYRPGITAAALYERYMSFGDDPFIDALDGPSEGVLFSAASYAKERCCVICATR